MTENLDKIGKIADDLDSLVAALELPLSPAFHIKQLKKILPEKAKAIKEALILESGENPWE